MQTDYQRDYEKAFRWRDAWTRLAARKDRGRLQSRQEAIERRAKLANGRIANLMHRFDSETRCANN